MSIFLATEIHEGVIAYCSGKQQKDNPHKTEPSKSDWDKGWLRELKTRTGAR